MLCFPLGLARNQDDDFTSKKGKKSSAKSSSKRAPSTSGKGGTNGLRSGKSALAGRGKSGSDGGRRKPRRSAREKVRERRVSNDGFPKTFRVSYYLDIPVGGVGALSRQTRGGRRCMSLVCKD